MPPHSAPPPFTPGDRVTALVTGEVVLVAGRGPGGPCYEIVLALPDGRATARCAASQLRLLQPAAVRP